MTRYPPSTKRTDTLFPFTTLCRSVRDVGAVGGWKQAVYCQVTNCLRNHQRHAKRRKYAIIIQLLNRPSQCLLENGNLVRAGGDSGWRDRKSTRLNSSH